MSSPQEKILTKFLWDEEYIKWNKNKSKVNIQNLNLVLFTFFFWVNLHHIDFVCLIDNFGLIRALSVFFHIFYFAPTQWLKITMLQTKCVIKQMYNYCFSKNQISKMKICVFLVMKYFSMPLPNTCKSFMGLSNISTKISMWRSVEVSYFYIPCLIGICNLDPCCH